MPKISVITTSIRPAGLEIVRQSLIDQTFRSFEWLTEINWTGEHDLNASYNRLIKRARGELIISIQDHIKIGPDALQKLWDAYQESPNTFFTCPVGKTKHENYWRGEEEAKWDWRINKDAIMDWRMWEIDFGACPKEALYKIGGFDEELDGLWSMDNVSVGKRADKLGYIFKCLRDIKGIAYDHDAFTQHPFRKDYKPTLSNMVMERYEENQKLDYL